MKTCPQCGDSRSFGNNEEYCTVHVNTRLFSKSREDRIPPGSNAASEPKEDHGLVNKLKALFSKGSPVKNDEQLANAILPQPLIDQGWRMTTPSPLRSIGSADYFVVSNETNQSRAILKNYRTHCNTSPEVYAVLESVQHRNFVPLLFSGNVQAGPLSLDSELLALTEVSLFQDSLSPDNCAVDGIPLLLQQGAILLRELMAKGLTCPSFTPESLIVSADGGLQLADYSQIFNLAPEDRVVKKPSFQVSAYTAPEIVQSNMMSSNKSPLFSLGAIVSRMAWGFVPNRQAIMDGDLDFAGLPPEILPPVMGLLYPHPKERWSIAELERWLAGEAVATPDWSRLNPGASSRALVIHECAVYLPQDLSAHLYRDVDTAAERLDEILGWLCDIPRKRDVALEIRRNQAAGRSSDWLALRLAFLLNPRCPRAWRGISLEEDIAAANLAELGRRAANNDTTAVALVAKLHGAQLNDVFGR